MKLISLMCAMEILVTIMAHVLKSPGSISNVHVTMDLLVKDVQTSSVLANSFHA